MFDSWTIVGVSEGPGLIPQDVSFALKLAACRLFKEKRNKLLFQSEICSGLIETEWDSKRLGSISGMLFHVEVDAEKGTWQVNFLMNPADLERGAERLEDPDDENFEWLSRPSDERYRLPVAELYKFKDLSSRSRN